MIYCDASLVVALIVEESGSAAVERWVNTRSAVEMVVSDWVATEVASALAFKHRLGDLDAPSLVRAITLSKRFLTSLERVRVEPRHFAAAGERFVSAAPSGLRAGDALHLAIVADNGFGLATLDRKFAEAARRCGITVETITGN